MGKGRAKWRFELGTGASLVSLNVSHEAERVRGGGRECLLGGRRWSGLGRGGDSRWGLGLLL